MSVEATSVTTAWVLAVSKSLEVRTLPDAWNIFGFA
jgi:hypothetical protein